MLPGGRVNGEALVSVFESPSRPVCRLTEQAIDVLPLCNDVKGVALTPGPLSQHPSRVQGAEEEDQGGSLSLAYFISPLL